MTNSNGSYCNNKERAYALKTKIRELHGDIPVDCKQILYAAREIKINGIGAYDPNNIREQLFGTFGTNGDIPLLVLQGGAREVKIGKQYSF